MAKVILICGKICVGKSTYADLLRVKEKAVLLSVDEISLAVFGQYIGEKHDEYVANIQEYLFRKSLEMIENDINVILDWGFWQKNEREYAKEFYRSKGIQAEFHYIDIDNETWKARINKRNADIVSNKVDAYYVDENLALKFGAIFEAPDTDEMDVWVKQ